MGRANPSNIANQAGNGNFFTGHFNYNNMNYDPYLSGYAFIIWTKVPNWLGDAENGGIFENAGTEHFKNLTQKNFKSLGGLSSITLETGTTTHGFAGNEKSHAQSISKANTEFTLSHQEFSGSPITRYYQNWVGMVRDPETGIAVYPKKYDLDYNQNNHTGELLYVVTRPDANNHDGGQNIEFASYWTQVMPTIYPLDHYNFDEGTHDTTQIEQTFSGNFHTSPKIYEFATQHMDKVYDFQGMDNYDPEGGPEAPNAHTIQDAEGDTL